MTILFFTIITIVSAVLPMLLGKKYPYQAAMFNGLAVACLYLSLAFFTETFFRAMSLLFASSLVSLYLGVFLGNKYARILQISVILISGILIVVKFWGQIETQMEILAVMAIFSTLATQMLLFELGSYLYMRSQRYAYFDALTSVLNMHGIEEYAKIELARAARADQTLSIAVIDLIGFKNLNDTFGHARGDEMLQKTANHLESGLRAFDLVGRIGGDEFIVFLPDTSVAEANEIISNVELTAPVSWRFEIIENQPGEGVKSAVKRATSSLFSANYQI